MGCRAALNAGDLPAPDDATTIVHSEQGEIQSDLTWTWQVFPMTPEKPASMGTAIIWGSHPVEADAART